MKMRNAGRGSFPGRHVQRDQAGSKQGDRPGEAIVAGITEFELINSTDAQSTVVSAIDPHFYDGDRPVEKRMLSTHSQATNTNRTRAENSRNIRRLAFNLADQSSSIPTCTNTGLTMRKTSSGLMPTRYPRLPPLI